MRTRFTLALAAFAVASLIIAVAPRATAVVLRAGTPEVETDADAAEDPAARPAAGLGDDAPADEIEIAATPAPEHAGAAATAQSEATAPVDVHGGHLLGNPSLAGASAPSLLVAPAPSIADLRVGAIVTFTVTVKNPTGAAVGPAAVNAHLPPNRGLTWSFDAPSQGSCRLAPDTVTCDFGDVAAGGAAKVAIRAVLGEEAACGEVRTETTMSLAGGPLSTVPASVVVRGCPPAIATRIDAASPPSVNQPFSVAVAFQPIPGLGDVGGTASVYVCGPTAAPVACTSGGNPVGVPEMTIYSNAVTAGPFVPTQPGAYCVRVDFTPEFDSSYTAASHSGDTADECLAVVASSLTLTLLTPDTVRFGGVARGEIKPAPNAVRVRVESTGGGWSAGSCYVADDHGEALPASALAWRRTGTSTWTAFGLAGTGAGCIPASASGPQTYAYDYLLTVPPTGATGRFDLTIVYTVEG